ncbi:MAG: hypothetical protein IJU76_09405 [Desulfovibrionaceae bacterium]|nr:hypothetical protein [Desulfovibrionaceae bacterium]
MAQIAVESEAFVQEYQAGVDDAAVPATDPEYEAWFRHNVEAGLRDIREGRVATQEQIEADALQRRIRLLAVR